MMNKKIIILVSLLFSTSVFASSNNSAATTNIAELFPYAAQSHNSKGTFDSQWGTYIIGSRGNMVDFEKHGNLNGKCYNNIDEYNEKKDDGDNIYFCNINNQLAPSYNLKGYSEGKRTEELVWLRPKPSGVSTSNTDVKCDYNNNIKSTFYDNSYKKFIVQNECTIASSFDDVIIMEIVSVTGDGTLYLKPGNYWLDTLELAGSGKIKAQPNKSGAINLYIKDQANLKSSAPLGTLSNPVNIIYEHELQIHSNEVTGMVRAKKISLKGGSAKLNLIAGEYWFENINLSGSAQLTLHDSALTTLHIKDQIEAQGGSTIINKENKPLLIYLYNNNNASLHLQGSAELHGHVYTKGGVELNEGHIYGAVNVHSLFMKGGSIIYRPLSGVPEAKLDHYQLHFNTNNDNVTAYACGHNTCNLSNLYAGEVKKLHIHANKSNFHNFDKFYGSSSITKKWDRSQCTIFTIQNADNNKKGANPWPASTPALQCFLDGTRVANCEVCPKPESVNSYGYVYGSATIPSIPSSRTNEFTVKQGGGNGLATAEDNPIAINNDSKLTLPLEVTFDKAEQVNLVLADADDREYPVSVTFVPKRLAWVNNSEQCINGEANKAHFNYQQHHGSCKVLGKAGADTTLVIKAHGEDDKLITNMPDYKIDKDSLITINELDDKKQKTDVSLALNSIKLENDKAEITYSISQVALIQAVIKEHCAPYAIDSQGECGLTTEGDSQILGRTVPAYLTVANKGAGIIENDVAYRGKEVVFTANPYFEVMGCAKGQEKDKCSLPSYKGEFAQDLTQYASITLEDSAEYEEVVSAVNQLESEDKEGTHQLELNVDLIPKKEQPQAVTLIEDKLALKIEGHDGLDELTDEVLIAEKKAQLRYGFLTINNLELLTRTAGDMPLHLHYYGDTLKEIKEDTKTNLELTASKNNVYLQLADNSPTLELDSNDKKLTVKKHDTEWSGTVELTVEPWLQPYNEAQLKNPEANLVISEQARKRGHDRVFNRREAVQ